MRQKITANLGIPVNYGMQAFYRAHGIEPCCGICQHFQGTPENLDSEYRFCWKQNKSTRDGDVCYSPERAPGADDES